MGPRTWSTMFEYVHKAVKMSFIHICDESRYIENLYRFAFMNEQILNTYCRAYFVTCNIFSNLSYFHRPFVIIFGGNGAWN